MAILLSILAMVAFGLVVVGWLWITVTAFSEGETLWGIGCLIISPLSLVYGFLNLQELRTPFFMLVGGMAGRIAVGVLSELLT